MRASPDHWPRHADALRSTRGTPSRVARPTSDTQKGFSQLYSHHGFNPLTPPKVPIPHQWTFPEHEYELKVLLEKRHKHLRRERWNQPKHTSQGDIPSIK